MTEPSDIPSTDTPVKESVDNLKRTLEAAFEETLGSRSDLASNLKVIRSYLESSVPKDLTRPELTPEALAKEIDKLVNSRVMSEEEVNLRAIRARKQLEKQEAAELEETIANDPVLKKLEVMRTKGADLEELLQERSNRKGFFSDPKLNQSIQEAKAARELYFQEFEKYKEAFNRPLLTQEEYDRYLETERQKRKEEIVTAIKTKNAPATAAETPKVEASLAPEAGSSAAVPSKPPADVISPIEGIGDPVSDKKDKKKKEKSKEKQKPIGTTIGPQKEVLATISPLDIIAAKSLEKREEKPSLNVNIIDIDKEVFKRLQYTITAAILEAGLSAKQEGGTEDDGDTTIINSGGKGKGKGKAPKPQKLPEVKPPPKFGRMLKGGGALALALGLISGGMEYYDTKSEAEKLPEGSQERKLKEQQALGRATGQTLQTILTGAVSVGAGIGMAFLASPTGPAAPFIGAATTVATQQFLDNLLGDTGATTAQNLFVDENLKSKLQNQGMVPGVSRTTEEIKKENKRRQEQQMLEESEVIFKPAEIPKMGPLDLKLPPKAISLPSYENQPGPPIEPDRRRVEITPTPGSTFKSLTTIPEEKEDMFTSIGEGLKILSQDIKNTNASFNEIKEMFMKKPEALSPQIASVQTNYKNDTVNNFPILTGALARKEEFNFFTGVKYSV